MRALGIHALEIMALVRDHDLELPEAVTDRTRRRDAFAVGFKNHLGQ